MKNKNARMSEPQKAISLKVLVNLGEPVGFSVVIVFIPLP
jgi:hypothetical protein